MTREKDHVRERASSPRKIEKNIKKPADSTSTHEGEHTRERSHSDPPGHVQKKRRTRRRLSLCVVLAVVMMGGACVAMLSMLLQESAEDNIGMVNFTLRITNMEFQPALRSRFSAVFRAAESQVCYQIVKSFKGSDYSRAAVNCWIRSFRGTDVMADVDLRIILPNENTHVTKIGEVTDNETESSFTTLSPNQVTFILFEAATHVIKFSSVRWLLGNLEIDPSTLPALDSTKGPAVARRPREVAGRDDKFEKEHSRFINNGTGNPDTEEKANSADTEIEATAKGGLEGTESVHMECEVKNPGAWRSLTILRHFRNGSNQGIVHVTPLAEPFISDVSRYSDVTRYTVNATLKSGYMRVRLDIASPTCWDAGTYTCWMQTDQSPIIALTRLPVHSQPSNPSLHVPSDLIEGHDLPEPITCHADLGSPPGRLRMFRYHSNQPFQEIKEEDGLKLQYREVGCHLVAELSLTSISKVNGTELMCLVQNTHLEVGSVFKETRATLLEIPMSVCSGKTPFSKVSHPYNRCRKYLVCNGSDVYVATCPVGHCFNPDPAQCSPEKSREGGTHENVRDNTEL